jgi:hypothetical protein
VCPLLVDGRADRHQPERQISIMASTSAGGSITSSTNGPAPLRRKWSAAPRHQFA